MSGTTEATTEVDNQSGVIDNSTAKPAETNRNKQVEGQTAVEEVVKAVLTGEACRYG